MRAFPLPGLQTALTAKRGTWINAQEQGPYEIENSRGKKNQGQAKKGRFTWGSCSLPLSRGPPLEVLCLDPWSKIAGFGAAKGITPRAEGPW